MRENTRCDVDDPISPPTDRMTISSSPSRVRPLLEKKIRPPSASVMRLSRSSEQDARIEFQAQDNSKQQVNHGSGGGAHSDADRKRAAALKEQRRKHVEGHGI